MGWFVEAGCLLTHPVGRCARWWFSLLNCRRHNVVAVLAKWNVTQPTGHARHCGARRHFECGLGGLVVLCLQRPFGKARNESSLSDIRRGKTLLSVGKSFRRKWQSAPWARAGAGEGETRKPAAATTTTGATAAAATTAAIVTTTFAPLAEVPPPPAAPQPRTDRQAEAAPPPPVSRQHRPRGAQRPLKRRRATKKTLTLGADEAAPRPRRRRGTPCFVLTVKFRSSGGSPSTRRTFCREAWPADLALGGWQAALPPALAGTGVRWADEACCRAGEATGDTPGRDSWNPRGSRRFAMCSAH